LNRGPSRPRGRLSLLICFAVASAAAIGPDPISLSEDLATAAAWPASAARSVRAGTEPVLLAVDFGSGGWLASVMADLPLLGADRTAAQLFAAPGKTPNTPADAFGLRRVRQPGLLLIVMFPAYVYAAAPRSRARVARRRLYPPVAYQGVFLAPSVTNPARSECPPSLAIWAVV